MLEACRAAIDAIDEQLLSLLEARLAQVEQVGLYKKEKQLAVKDTSREAALLKRLEQKSTQKENWQRIAPIFKEILEVSREQQKACLAMEADLPTVAYFGQPGSYTHEAMKRYFKTETEGQSAQSFEAVAEAVLSGACVYGVLPIENSSTGSIHAVYDLLGQHPLRIVGEIRCPIEHYLLAQKGTGRAQVQKVYSHPQALSQCQRYLAAGGYLAEAVSSSSQGASLAAKHSETAAIGNLEAALLYGLEILDGPINDYGLNQTRFIIFKADDGTVDGTYKNGDTGGSKGIGMTFQIPNLCGKLCQVLKIFEDCQLNLLKIESRPIGERPFEYQFYMDFEGELGGAAVREALAQLKEQTIWMKVLGTWER